MATLNLPVARENRGGLLLKKRSIEWQIKNWESKLPTVHPTALTVCCSSSLEFWCKLNFRKSLLDSAYLSLARLLLSSARQLSSISHHEMITIIILCGRLLACNCLDGQIQEHSWSRSDSLHLPIYPLQQVQRRRCQISCLHYEFPTCLWTSMMAPMMFVRSQLFWKSINSVYLAVPS